MSTWILLRGLTREAGHWGGFPEDFERIVGASTSITRVVSLELPGNGSACRSRSPTRVAQIVDAVRAAATAQSLVPPYRVLAMSLGGMVATEWAQRYPDEIERLVLINTSMRPFCSMVERLRPSAWPRVKWIAATWRWPRTCERAIHRLTCSANEHDERDVAAWAELRRARPVSAINGLRQLLAAARFEARHDAPQCPTLLLSSGADRLVNPACSSRIASHWGALHREHPWAGHDLPHDVPVWVSEAVSRWLVAHAERGATGTDGVAAPGVARTSAAVAASMTSEPPQLF